MADVKALMQVPGIGKKGAERLILELRDRLGATTTDTQLDGGAAPTGLPAGTPAAPWRDPRTPAPGRPGRGAPPARAGVVHADPPARRAGPPLRPGGAAALASPAL